MEPCCFKGGVALAALGLIGGAAYAMRSVFSGARREQNDASVLVPDTGRSLAAVSEASIADMSTATPFVATAMERKDTEQVEEVISSRVQKRLDQVKTSSIPTDGLVAYYPFNGNANDESGNANHGTVYNATLTADRFGNANRAYSFDGLNSYIDGGNNPILQITGTLSVSFWMKASVIGDTGYHLVSWHECGYNNGWLHVIHPGLNRIQVYHSGSWGIGASSLATNTWYHIAAVHDTATDKITLYVNNNLDLTVGSCGVAVAPPVNFLMGRGCRNQQPTYPAYYFAGILDDVRVYSRSLTLAELTALYNEPNPGPLPQPPALTTNQLTIAQGQTVTITSSMLSATDADTPDSGLTFTISSLQHGQFKIAGSAVTSFTQAQVKAGGVSFVHDGTATAPSYSVVVSDGTTSTTAAAATITFDDTPVLTANQLTIVQGQTLVLTTNNLNAADQDQSAAQLTFTVSSVQHGRFERTSAAGTTITSFTLQEVQNGAIRFVHDGTATAPSYSVVVSDGTTSTTATEATVSFTLAPTPTSSPTPGPSPESASNTGLIAVAAGGGIVVLGGAACFFRKCVKHKRVQEKQPEGEEMKNISKRRVDDLPPGNRRPPEVVVAAPIAPNVVYVPQPVPVYVPTPVSVPSGYGDYMPPPPYGTPLPPAYAGYAAQPYESAPLPPPSAAYPGSAVQPLPYGSAPPPPPAYIDDDVPPPAYESSAPKPR